MPQWTSWKRYTRTVVERLPRNRSGAYQIANRGMTIVDTGGSESEWSSGIRERLIARILANKCPSGYWFRFRYADWLDSSFDIEGKTTRKIIARTDKRPKYNKRTPRPNPYW